MVVLDVKKKFFGGYEILTHNATKKTKWKLKNCVESLQKAGVGEIVINSIDNDGMMQGYNSSLIDILKPLIDVPFTMLGGAGSHDDIKKLIEKYGIIGCAAGSLFVFKGKYRAVLINYPNPEEKERIVGEEVKQ